MELWGLIAISQYGVQGRIALNFQRLHSLHSLTLIQAPDSSTLGNYKISIPQYCMLKTLPHSLTTTLLHSAYNVLYCFAAYNGVCRVIWWIVVKLICYFELLGDYFQPKSLERKLYYCELLPLSTLLFMRSRLTRRKCIVLPEESILSKTTMVWCSFQELKFDVISLFEKIDYNVIDRHLIKKVKTDTT